MKSLREFAQFVGKPNSPISPRALAEYLKLGINPNAISLRELVGVFDSYTQPFAIEEVSVEPRSRTVPFEIGMQVVRSKGFPLETYARWRILLNGQQVAHYELPQVQVAHTFSEPGNYTVEAMVKGIGSTGYVEATKSVTVEAKPKVEPPPQPTKLTLTIGSTELVPGVLRIISADWKVIPRWNPSQVINLTGFNPEVTLPAPPSSADQRIQVELSFRCAVAGVLNGVEFPYQEFDGVVDPFPNFIGWEDKPLNAGWALFWDLVIVGDNDDNPNNNPVKVVVVAKLVSIS